MPLVVAQTLGRVVSDLDGSVTKVQSVMESPTYQLDCEKVHGLAGVEHDEAVLLVRAELKPARPSSRQFGKIRHFHATPVFF